MKRQLKQAKYLFILPIVLLLFSSCGEQMVLPSVEFDSCFMNYNKLPELEDQLNKLSASIDLENPNASAMAVVGCLHYQMNQHELAKKWLKKAYSTAGEDDNAKNTAAAALGLIHIKNQEHQSILPYITSAQKNHLGRWMLVLYYVDFYRKYDNTEYLGSAIRYMRDKHQKEGETPATRRLLSQMLQIHSMEKICKDTPGNELCNISDLEEEKRYLFSTTWGFLSMLLKQPPFNSV